MKKICAKILRYLLIGTGFGSVSYLLIITFRIQPDLPTVKNTLSILVMSMLIGLVSLIFEVDRISFLLELLVHFCATLTLVIAMVIFNGWGDYIFPRPGFWLLFLGIYGAVWFVISLNLRINAQEMNEQLRKKRSNDF
ncbi:DUF3021 domain-containing protein [Xylocopilactobacillus apicola]|uniref:DUF3021 domain-containing protein n=1 Tax=Xylocopilactobacillus apicola TaxID=2932184 RepID=A0AAU9D010_9LACO|nr:DUF3021 domain-containing protein [Xylocopilactobacillus apicola]BDR58026.1 hypothetical protein XA3_04670 [Xylocopilactobacillus apicola]